MLQTMHRFDYRRFGDVQLKLALLKNRDFLFSVVVKTTSHEVND